MSVRTALVTHLAGWVSAQNLPVAWENQAFTPPAGTFLRAFLLPAGRSALSLCDIEEAGVLQVSIYVKRDTGTGPVTALAESLCAHFAPAQYAGFQIQSPPFYAQGLNTDDGRYLLPVSIFYRAIP